LARVGDGQAWAVQNGSGLRKPGFDVVLASDRLEVVTHKVLEAAKGLPSLELEVMGNAVANLQEDKALTVWLDP
jgi:hypothetical protein